MSGKIWGREESTVWPRRPLVWTLAALILAFAATMALWYYQYQVMWTPLERYWFPAYTRMRAMAAMGIKTGRYQLLEVVDRHNRSRLALDEDVVPVKNAASGYFSLASRSNLTRLTVSAPDKYDNERIKTFIGHWIYRDRALSHLFWLGWEGGSGVLALFLTVAIPLDIKRARMLRYGRRLKGPELVTVSTFNSRYRSRGVGFIQLERNVFQRVFGTSRTLRVPQRAESQHFLVMGDTGAGKSALIRQVLTQIEERGETAIVYDPAREYTPQFYNPRRGDMVLNPLDERMPYWSPGEEVRHEAEALTLAASLFPDRHTENSFFVEGPRKIFAHLLTFKPSPSELMWWMSHPAEIDKRVDGTEYAAMIDPQAPPQRMGVLGSLNMVADALKLLPTEEQTTQRWNTLTWSQGRKGWLFLTSMPETRKKLLPLMSLWLDTLVLRLMSQGDPRLQPVWFVLDELASLRKLPQLETAVTENRKSNNPVVIGLQGKAQMETIYGHIAETMLSMLTTKIFLRTSEPRAAEWISRAIGEVEIEHLRESHTSEGRLRHRRSKNFQLERRGEPLVMASEITGLPDRHAYVKLGNLVVRLRFPYVQLPKIQPAFIERIPQPTKPTPDSPVTPPPPDATTGQKIEPSKAEQAQDQVKRQQLKQRAAVQEHFFE